jgi:hypothetical protein
MGIYKEATPNFRLTACIGQTAADFGTLLAQELVRDRNGGRLECLGMTIILFHCTHNDIPVTDATGI